MNYYILPLFMMFIFSFSIFQEKELKTDMILLTKRESIVSFLFKKSTAIQFSMLATFIGVYSILSFFMIGFLSFHLTSFIHFLIVIIVFIAIFNQLCIFLGRISLTKMQLIGVNILICFFVFFFIIILFILV